MYAVVTGADVVRGTKLGWSGVRAGSNSSSSATGSGAGAGLAACFFGFFLAGFFAHLASAAQQQHKSARSAHQSQIGKEKPEEPTWKTPELSPEPEESESVNKPAEESDASESPDEPEEKSYGVIVVVVNMVTVAVSGGGATQQFVSHSATPVQAAASEPALTVQPVGH